MFSNRADSVCIISEVAGYGTRTHTLDLGQRILDRGYCLELLSCRFDVFDDLPANWNSSRVKAHRTDLSAYDKSVSFRRWRAAFKNLDSRIVILQRSSMHFGTHPFLLACRMKFKKVYYIHHFSNEVSAARSSREKLKRCSKSIYATKIVVVSDFLREHLVNDWHYPAAKIECVVNGVSLTSFARDKGAAEEFKRQREVPLEATTFGVLARLDFEKGVDLAIDAFARLRSRHPARSLKLVLIGDGAEMAALRRLARESGVGSDVVFCGFMADPRPALFSVDILVAPSRKEPFGLSVIEGIAAGCLPVVFAVGGMTEIVSDSENGWRVPPNDVQALSMAMEEAMCTPESVRRKILKSAQERVKILFNADLNYPRVLDTFGIL